MRTINKKQAIVSILAILVLASLILLPSADALNFSFNDSSSMAVTVTGPANSIKQGDTVVFTVTLTLYNYMLGNAHFKLWLNSSSQTILTLVDQDIMAYQNWTAGSSFNQPFIVTISTNAANNAYVYATVDVGTKHFSNLIVGLIQNPTYTELQTQVIQLQTQVNNLTTQLSNLQNQLNTIQANNTNLQTQVNNLTSEKAALQVQVNNLQGNNSALQAQLSILNGNSTELQSQLNSLQAEKAALQSQVSSLQVEKTSLQAQVADLQTNNAALESQVGDLQSNKTVLQSLVTNLQGNNTELLSQVNDLQLKVNNLQLNNTNLQAIVDTFSLQIASLEQQVSDLQSQNSTTSILMYLAIFVAAVFIASTGYFLFVLLKRKKTTAEPPLY